MHVFGCFFCDGCYRKRQAKGTTEREGCNLYLAQLIQILSAPEKEGWEETQNLLLIREEMRWPPPFSFFLREIASSASMQPGDLSMTKSS